jgi:predicted transcriptional regulator
MKTPCEIIVWNIVPIIRKEFAKNLIDLHGLNQRTAAAKLGITESAISRYLSGKRGALEITDPDILNEIITSTHHIYTGKKTAVNEETCRICRLLKDKEFIEGITNACE